MGIKGEFYLAVSFDMLKDIISHVIPEGEIVNEKIKLGPVNANVWATRTDAFTTYVKDQALYLAAPFHVNLKFPNFFVDGIVGEQILEFTVTVKCAVITAENLKITLNLNVFDIDWQAKPTLPGGITVAGHVEPFFRDHLNTELQKVTTSINTNLSFQAEVESLLQKIQMPIKLQSFLLKSGSEGTVYYIHPNPEITITPIQITDTEIKFQAAIEVKTTIDLNPLAPNNTVIVDPNSPLLPQMFNACQSGNLATVKELHKQGISLSVRHPYNNVSLVHVACWPQVNPSGNGWHNISHTELVKWLMEEINKSPEELLSIFNEKIKGENIAEKAKYSSYHASILDYDNYSGKSLKEFFDAVFACKYGCYVEISGQSANPFWQRDLAYGTKTYHSFNATKLIVDKYFTFLQEQEIEKLSRVVQPIQRASFFKMAEPLPQQQPVQTTTSSLSVSSSSSAKATLSFLGSSSTGQKHQAENSLPAISPQEKRPRIGPAPTDT